MNIPDGEVYSAPVRDSVNGVITYNAPSITGGVKYENDTPYVQRRKDRGGDRAIIRIRSTRFSIRTRARATSGNSPSASTPISTQPMGDIFFDEKIAGSIHFTPGACYDDCYNGNVSAIHWDLVLIMTPEYGGGEIWFDDVLIRRDGLFVIDELKGLNPENLK